MYTRTAPAKVDSSPSTQYFASPLYKSPIFARGASATHTRSASSCTSFSIATVLVSRMALTDTKLTIDGVDKPEVQKEDFDYAHRAQWLRAAVLGANDGLVSTASMMMGVSAVKTDVKSMVLTGFAGLVAGACSMAIGEFVSVYSQVDVEVAQMKRDKRKRARSGIEGDDDGSGSDAAERPDQLPSPVQAAVASAMAFSVGALVPLLAAGFIRRYRVRLGVVPAAVTLALLGFGVTGARLGGVPVGRSAARVLVGGWMAMAVTYGLMKVVGRTGGL